MDELTIDDILEEYGHYYEKNNQSTQRMIMGFMEGPETTKFATHIDTKKDTIYKLVNPLFESVLQSFQLGFTPKGKASFLPNPIHLNHMKVDYAFYPQVIEDSWMAFLKGDSSRNIEDWPIVRYMLEVYLVQKAIEDKELHEVYKGVFAEPTEGVASALGTNMDGILKRLKIGAVDFEKPINIIDGIGELNKDTIFDQIEMYDEAISDKYTGQKLIHFVSPEFKRAFLKDKRSKGYLFIDSIDKLTPDIDFTEHVIVGVPSMRGTKHIFTTIKENFLHLTNGKEVSPNDVDIQKYNRQIKFLVDWWEAVGFGYNCMVWTTRETVADVNPIAITAVDAKLTTSPAVTLQATPAGCVFSGVGVTLVEGTYKFTPSVAGAGTHTIKATLEMANDNKWEKTIQIVVTVPEG